MCLFGGRGRLPWELKCVSVDIQNRKDINLIDFSKIMSTLGYLLVLY